ncbi:hypothetical protein XpopCFBP1817_01545 [Xanthomonas populi]|uniref:Uncharacterized protein n=1 Tax=Xanthomonas populi TaxID=53414 RepID=A0A2S7F448_9XANT|nr:hypothetical protein XpopCFBP1817_01545 [Xanthomonas populi]
MGRARGALAARGTRREPVPGGPVAASMPPHGPAIGEDTAPGSWLVVGWKPACCLDCVGELNLFKQRTSCSACIMHTDHPDWSLPTHRRGTLRGMDAA